MAEARRTSQIPGWRSRTKAAQEQRALMQKTFEELTLEEKDQLLKNVALRLGLIAPSETDPQQSRDRP